MVRCPLEFEGKVENKLLVVVGHANNSLICFKATSKLGRYQDAMNASTAVFYKADDPVFFTKDTAIQIDNYFAVPYQKVSEYFLAGSFSVLGVMPPDFFKKLEQTIEGSGLLSRIRKDKILAFLRK